MNLPTLTNRSLELLERILDQAHGRLPEKLDFTSCPVFIYLHARNICELGKDTLVLEGAEPIKSIADFGPAYIGESFQSGSRG